MALYSLLPGKTFPIRAVALSATFFLLCPLAQGQNGVASKVTTFFDTDARTFEADLWKYRPLLSAELLAAGLESFVQALPLDGEATNLNASERQKLASLDRVLNSHERRATYHIKVLRMPQSAVGLYERSVLWISQPALDLLNAEELQAVVAHEIAHDYVWEETRSAQRTANYDRSRQIELFCDAIAMLTLRHIGVNPGRLAVGIAKLDSFNQERFGTPVNSNSYPTATERRQFAKKVIQWMSQ